VEVNARRQKKKEKTSIPFADLIKKGETVWYPERERGGQLSQGGENKETDQVGKKKRR